MTSTAPARPTQVPAFKRYSLGRVAAMVTRYLFLMRSSWARIIDLVYWPILQLLTWGFLQSFLVTVSPEAGPGRATIAAGTLIGSMLLWDILQRGQIGFSLTFLEEMWSRNIGNLLMTPLRASELVLAMMVMSVLRLAIGFVPVSLLAIWFFGFNVWAIGLGFALFFANLIFTSWSIGLLVSGLILRHGMGAENVAWTLTFLLLPLCAVYYPAATLPGWLQAISWALPPTYVFEGMRHLLLEKTYRGDLMLEALLLNALLFAAASLAFIRLLHQARDKGSLLQMGE